VGLTAIWAAALSSLWAGEKVALRTPDGRFLRAAEDGALRPDRLIPGEQATFELVTRDGGLVTLEAFDGRFLVADGRDARTLRADSPRSEPGDRETFRLIPADGNRVGMKARSFRSFIAFGRRDESAEAASGESPSDGEAVEIYRVSEVPSGICSALAAAIRGLVVQELADKQYDKTRSRHKEKYVELPAPTFRDPRRKKRVRVLSIDEQTQVQARLDGTPDVRIRQMCCLRGHQDLEARLFMFDLEADVPVWGRVRYRIPGALSASTGFRGVVRLATVGQVGTGGSDADASFQPPRLVDLRVDVCSLDLSNDVLQLARGEIEGLVNRELVDRKDKIREQANKAIRKAIDDQHVRLPLLGYLGLP
jgi:hypothetical protein